MAEAGVVGQFELGSGQNELLHDTAKPETMMGMDRSPLNGKMTRRERPGC